MIHQRTVIIGYGNPIRGDDAVGWMVANQLSARLSDNDQIEVVAAHQILPEQVELLRKSDRVIFIDADLSLLPGEVSIDSISAASSDVQIHTMEPVHLLRLCQQLYQVCPTAFFVRIGCTDFEYRESLSALLQAKLDEIVDTVLTILSAKKKG